MNVSQRQFKNGLWSDSAVSAQQDGVTVVLGFGSRDNISQQDRFDEIRSFYPSGFIVTASTAGEILDTHVDDDTISLTALHFDQAYCEAYSQTIQSPEETYSVAKDIAGKLSQQELKHVLVFSDGLVVNGSDLAKGILEVLPEKVTVTGGMAGDSDRFEQTYCGLNEKAVQNNIIVIGLYGQLEVTHGSFGGWDPFGVPRVVTRSKGNIVYELDHEPILELYKKYLGELAVQLPASGLLFPLNITQPGSDTQLVRTLLSINESEGSIVYAGDVPEGSTAQLMKANFNRLVEGAEKAAENAHQGISPDFALLISCVGRKLVLKERIEEEVEAVKSIMGETVHMAGFYSYGEIAPARSQSQFCELHNQTMTITTITEVV